MWDTDRAVLVLLCIRWGEWMSVAEKNKNEGLHATAETIASTGFLFPCGDTGF